MEYANIKIKDRKRIIFQVILTEVTSVSFWTEWSREQREFGGINVMDAQVGVTGVLRFVCIFKFLEILLCLYAVNCIATNGLDHDVLLQLWFVCKLEKTI